MLDFLEMPASLIFFPRLSTSLRQTVFVFGKTRVAIVAETSLIRRASSRQVRHNLTTIRSKTRRGRTDLQRVGLD